MRNYLTELVGTFFLVLTIGLTVLGGTEFAPLAIGSALMVMVYMGGHISGGHYNPAVTLAVYLRGKLPAREVLPYWIAQLVGAMLAALSVFVITERTFQPMPGAGVSMGDALFVEFLFTFALALVVLNSATATKTEGNSFYGLAIGITVMVGAFAGGAISGGAFNPAVGVGPALVSVMLGDGSLAPVWLYIVAPLLGGAVAAAMFRLQNPHDVAPPIPAATGAVPSRPAAEPIPRQE
ncbi:MAG TPA: aquaporin [Gemmatimonadaceae bacterium]|nr:aquaporin [Gemmatimonadaceae bacterium]